MKTIDWMYHRKGCTTCSKSDGFLSSHNLQVKKIVDCKKEVMQQEEALSLLSGIDKIYATKGVKVVELNLKASKPTESQVAELLIGPSGKLRAPTIISGKTMLVGFNETMYRDALSIKS